MTTEHPYRAPRFPRVIVSTTERRLVEISDGSFKVECRRTDTDAMGATTMRWESELVDAKVLAPWLCIQLAKVLP